MPAPERHGQDQLIPFLWLRRSIGFLGIIFPIILVVGTQLFSNCPNTFLDSISAYYYTNMREVFVSILSIIAIFLFTYRGVAKTDSIAANLAGLFALGIAFFPTNPDGINSLCIACEVKEHGNLHNFCAASFFLTITYFSLVLFPKTKKDKKPTAQKLKRNVVYKVCGYIMLASLVIIVLFKTPIIHSNLPITFIFEWVSLWAFGISWIVKGEWFLQDK